MKYSITIPYQYETGFSPFSVEEYAEALVWAKENGLDGVELCISDYENVSVERIREELDRIGLACSTISTGQALGRENISLLHADEDAAMRAQQRFVQHINAASILGSKVTIGLLRGIGSGEGVAQQSVLLRERLLPLVEQAESRNVTLLIEPINRYETQLLNDTEGTVSFIESSFPDSMRVKVLWDVFHANIEEREFCETIDRFANRIGHVHLADSNRLPPHFGHINFHGIFQMLKDHNYDQFVSFECRNLPSIENTLQSMAAFVKEMKTRY